MKTKIACAVSLTIILESVFFFPLPLWLNIPAWFWIFCMIFSWFSDLSKDHPLRIAGYASAVTAALISPSLGVPLKGFLHLVLQPDEKWIYTTFLSKGTLGLIAVYFCVACICYASQSRRIPAQIKDVTKKPCDAE